MTELPLSDLPDGEWSFLLVGAWWPGAPDKPTEGITHWTDHADVKKREAEHVQAHRQQFGSRNHGRTAADMMERFRIGRERLLDAEEHCRAKSSASRKVADAVTELRTQLRACVGADLVAVDEDAKDGVLDRDGDRLSLVAASDA